MDTKYIKIIFFIYIIFYCCTFFNGIKAKISVADDYKLKYNGEKNDEHSGAKQILGIKQECDLVKL